ncbi:MAG: DedA family protein [Minisyncoccota bacterium]
MSAFLVAVEHLNPIAMLHAGGYVGLALLVFAESGLLFGIFLPGDSLLFVAGLLAAGGILAIWPLIAVVVVSAIIGDSVGYWFGAKAGDTLSTREDSRFFKKEYLQRTESFYEAYGGRAIILARFVPVVRTIAPILAGIGSMKYRTFLSYNIIGGVAWGAGMVSLGYFLGSVIPNSEKYILPLSLVIVVASFLPVLVGLFRSRSV